MIFENYDEIEKYLLSIGATVLVPNKEKIKWINYTFDDKHYATISNHHYGMFSLASDYKSESDGTGSVYKYGFNFTKKDFRDAPHKVVKQSGWIKYWEDIDDFIEDGYFEYKIIEPEK